MRKIHMINKAFSEPYCYSVRRSAKPLSITKTDCLWDNYQHKLMLFIASDQLFSQESKVWLKDQLLLVESPVVSAVKKPFRTHLIDREIREEVEKGILEIGVAKITLKSGYHYTLQSFQLINSSLIKVSLSYQIAAKLYNN
jgi:hypothetical protein